MSLQTLKLKLDQLQRTKEELARVFGFCGDASYQDSIKVQIPEDGLEIGFKPTPKERITLEVH